MTKRAWRRLRRCLPLLLVLLVPLAHAGLTEELERSSAATLNALYASSPAASALGAKAKGMLVFPDVRQSSFEPGARAGDGVLFIGGAVAGHYALGDMAAHLGAGAQSYGYAIFLMSDAALERLGSSDGLDPGLDPDVVCFEIGAVRELRGLAIEPWGGGL